MVGLPKRLHFLRRDTDNHLATSSSTPEGSIEFADKHVNEKQVSSTSEVVPDSEARAASSSDEVPDDNVQDGVRRAEAVTLTWSRTSLAIAYASMFLLYFVNAFQASITGNLTPFVLSGFEAHSLIPVIAVVSNVMSAATYLPLAKILDLWGRPLGFLSMAVIATVGLIMMAATNNVETYAAAQVLEAVEMLLSMPRAKSESGLLFHRFCRHDL